MGGGGKSQAGFGFLFSAEACGGMLKPPWPSGEQTPGLNTGLEFPGREGVEVLVLLLLGTLGVC